MSAVKKALDAMKAAGRAPSRPVASPDAAPSEDVERFRRQVAERDAALTRAAKENEQLRAAAAAVAVERDRERTRAAVVKAASAANAIDPEDLADLLSSRLRYVDGKAQHAEDARDVGAVVAEYLAGKPHHVRAQVAAGTGATARTAPAPGPAPAGVHDTTTRAGATAALHEGLLRSITRKAG